MTPEFRAQLKRKLAPLLRGAGFSGSGVCFRRLTGEVIQVLHVQGSRYGGSCCVNLGIHLTFLPTVLGHPPEPKKIAEMLCEFRRRLAPVGQSDCWWEYGSGEREAARSVDSLVELAQLVGLPHFDRFGVFPASFEGITPQALAAGDFSVLPGSMTAVRGALVMARIAAHLGRPDRVREFAAVGLASVPSAMRGVGIAGELAVLAAQAGGSA